jgi:hypothetical protein
MSLNTAQPSFNEQNNYFSFLHKQKANSYNGQVIEMNIDNYNVKKHKKVWSYF